MKATELLLLLHLHPAAEGRWLLSLFVVYSVLIVSAAFIFAALLLSLTPLILGIASLRKGCGSSAIDPNEFGAFFFCLFSAVIIIILFLFKFSPACRLVPTLLLSGFMSRY